MTLKSKRMAGRKLDLTAGCLTAGLFFAGVVLSQPARGFHHDGSEYQALWAASEDTFSVSMVSTPLIVSSIPWIGTDPVGKNPH